MKKLLLILAIAILAVPGCTKHPANEDGFDDVMILLSAGFNNLTFYLNSDITDLLNGTYLPGKDDRKAIIVISHTTKGGTYAKPNPPCIVRLYNSKNGAVRDTVKVLGSDDLLTYPSVLTESLNFITKNFPSESYGMVVSSHGTGWVPSGYYDNPVTKASTKGMKLMSANGDGETFYSERIEGENPVTKSFGSEVLYSSTGSSYVDMEIADMAAAIPVHLDYLLFDACLMGTIETAYEFRNVTDVVGFSPAEVLTEGFNYRKMAHDLLESKSPEAVCKDYFDYYDSLSGEESSATISLLDCSKIDKIASVCKTLFSKYATELESVTPGKVQRYFRPSTKLTASGSTVNRHNWYYDLEDIFIQCGAAESDIKELENAVSSAMIYKAATDSFMPSSGGFYLTHYSGLSMYLPADGNDYLDNFYKTLSWNQYTGLVK